MVRCAVTGVPTADDVRADPRLHRLLDQADLRDLIDRYLYSLDVRGFDEDWAREVFTDDVVLTFPVGSHQGRAGVAEFTDAVMRPWPATLHVGSNCTVDVTGDRARLTWNLLAAHVHPGSPPPPAPSDVFHLGGVFTGTAIRTMSGWRIQHLSLRVIWTAGHPA